MTALGIIKSINDIKHVREINVIFILKNRKSVIGCKIIAIVKVNSVECGNTAS